MSSAIVKFFSTTQSKLSSLEVVDGQLIFVKDVKKIFLDMNGVRLEYSCMQVFETDAHRVGTLAPVEGFYFVEETGIIWRYKTGWRQITPSNLEPLFFGTYEEFPSVGDKATLYITDDATYRWDTATQSYSIVATKQVWTELSA